MQADDARLGVNARFAEWRSLRAAREDGRVVAELEADASWSPRADDAKAKCQKNETPENLVIKV